VVRGGALNDRASQESQQGQRNDKARGAPQSKRTKSSSASRILSLQRTAGNSAVAGMLAGQAGHAHHAGQISVQRHTSQPLEFEENSVDGAPAVQRSVSAVQRTLVDKLNDAMAGWGTDEDAMRAAIAAASASEKAAALRDPRLLRRMQDELTASELREMLAGLDAPLALRLEAAMIGWNEDADVIVAMCKAAPAAQKLEVLRNPRLMARLREEFSSADAVSIMEELNAPIAQRLHAAMDGWGVDTAVIVRICASATPAQKQEAVRDRALIARLADEIESPILVQQVLKTLGVSLVDRMHTAMDGWGVDSSTILTMAREATPAEKTAVLSDTRTVARLRDELTTADTLTVLRDLDATITDRINVALGGWGVAAEVIYAIIEGASEAQRMTALADTALVKRLKDELEPEEAKQAVLLLRFGSQAAIDAASPEELEAETVPENLTALLSAALGAAELDIDKILSDIAAATDEDRALVRGNTSLMERLVAVFPPDQRQRLQQQLGVSVIDQLNTLIDQQAAVDRFTDLLATVPDDDKQRILGNRALLERLTAHLGTADMQRVLTLLGDTLTNQLQLAVEEGSTAAAMLALIEAATQDQRDAVRVHGVLLGQIGEALSPLEFWRVRLHLEFGSAVAYPAGVTTLLGVLQSSPTSGDIKRTIANFSDADFAAVRDVVGLRDVLRTMVDDETYLFLLRMLDEGLINEETEKSTYSETLQNDDPNAPGNIFIPMTYTGSTAFDVAQMRDRVQVNMRINMNAGDDGAKTKLTEYKNRLEPQIEGIWDGKYSLRNANRTIPISINCNFTSDSPHHSINVYAKSTGVKYGEYNLSNWYPDAAGFSTLAPAHEFGHMLGNRDEYNLSQADYIGTVGTDPTTDANATKETDDVGTERFTNDSVMGGNAAGRVDPRHLTYFVNWMNRNRRTKADGTFLEPAFSIV
jgi:hypothetical protein